MAILGLGDEWNRNRKCVNARSMESNERFVPFSLFNMIVRSLRNRSDRPGPLKIAELPAGEREERRGLMEV